MYKVRTMFEVLVKPLEAVCTPVLAVGENGSNDINSETSY